MNSCAIESAGLTQHKQNHLTKLRTAECTVQSIVLSRSKTKTEMDVAPE